MKNKQSTFLKAISEADVKYVAYDSILDCPNTELAASVAQGRHDVLKLLSSNEEESMDFGKKYVSLADVVGDAMQTLCAAYAEAPSDHIGRAMALLEAILYSVESLEEEEHLKQRTSVLELLKIQVNSLALSSEEKDAWLQKLNGMQNGLNT